MVSDEISDDIISFISAGENTAGQPILGTPKGLTFGALSTCPYTELMKKPTRESRHWNRLHARNSNRRRLVSIAKLKARRRAESRERKKSIEGRSYSTIECPKDFSLESNFDGVVRVLHEIRQRSQRQRNESIYIDFSKIRNLSPSAALVMAAEIDRWNHVPWRRGRRLQTVDDLTWDPRVRQQLADMGFFELLHTTWSGPEKRNAQHADTRYVKFRTGKKADGQVIDRLREEDLEPVVGAVPRKHYLYAAVTEAMTNVVHHAYPRGFRRNWWLSASHNAASGQVTIMIFDQGLGIPETLPRKFSEQLGAILPRDHARLIRAAHDLSRSASGEAYRGHGLQRDVRGYLERINCQATYRVVSLRGEYVCQVSSSSIQSRDLKSHLRALNGTLIEWKLDLQ